MMKRTRQSKRLSVSKRQRVDEQEDTSRDHNSRPHPETAKDGHEESADDQRPPSKAGRTFRVRGVPLEWDIACLQSFLADHDDSAGLIVRSLAHEIHGRSRTATVSFENDHNLVQTAQARHSWQIPLPADLTQSAHRQSLIFGDGFLGITTLYAPPPQHHEVDIVAISGLGGHAFGSFKERGGEHMWLRDALPYHITGGRNNPLARVMVYGYESSLPQSDSIQNLEDLGTSLHSSLLEWAHAATRRPIIFVAHSLGGLIVKQTLISLSNSQSEDDRKLIRAVYGIIFFGVPHDGMDIRSLITMVGDGPNRFLLESIGANNSQILSIQQREFHKVLGGKGESEVVCFYETRKSPTATKDERGRWQMKGPQEVLVTKPSATHGRPWEGGPEHICAVDRTHSEMVKFGPEDNEYEKVLQRIQGLVRRALVARSLNQGSGAKVPPHNCLKSLAFPQMESRSHDIGRAAKNTCEWLLRHETYKRWASCDRGLLWIKGKPGSGKSTLLKYALDNHQAMDGDLVLSFFFHGRGDKLQRTPLGLFRSLLHQILKQAPEALPDLIGAFEQKSNEYGGPGEGWQWHQEELWRFLESSLPKVLQTQSVWLFVDALDECGKEHALSLAEKFKSLFQGLPSIDSQLYICFTCRHYPILDPYCEFEICTEQENGEDISTFVHKRLSAFHARTSSMIPASITKRAAGVFMWARLVVEQVLDLDRQGKTLKMIGAAIRSIPPNLDNLYQDLTQNMERPP